MKKKVPPHKNATSNHPTMAPEIKNLKEKVESKEVAGRHKNDGQLAHKGAR